MIPYEIDPSLHATAPSAPRLDDGFAPLPVNGPAPRAAGPTAGPDAAVPSLEPAFGDKSLF